MNLLETRVNRLVRIEYWDSVHPRFTFLTDNATTRGAKALGFIQRSPRWILNIRGRVGGSKGVTAD